MSIRKLFVMVQWVALAALVGWLAKALLTPTPEPVYAPETWHHWRGFTALSYGGVAKGGDDPRYPSPRRLNEHLEALEAAGYRTITPTDALRFLRGEAPLPERALLLMFEGGRKDSFIRSTPKLRENGYQALMAVPTAFAGGWDRFHLNRTEIRKASRLPHWRFGSMGHEATERVETGPEGDRAPFLTARRWTEEGLETPEAYQARVREDIRTSWALLRQASRTPVLTFVYPYADAGTSPLADPTAAAVLRSTVGEYFRLAFARSDHPFNPMTADRLGLRRLRVPGAWTGDELVERLRAFAPARRVPLLRATGWTLGEGAELKERTLHLSNGGYAWMRGGDHWEDFEVHLTVSGLSNGTVAVYGRYEGPRAYVRITADARTLRIQERQGVDMYNLTVEKTDPSADTLNLTLRARGNRFWLERDGKTIGGPRPLADTTRAGTIGLEALEGDVVVQRVEGGLLPRRYVQVRRLSVEPVEGETGVEAMLPLWFDRDTDWEALRKAQEASLLRLAAQGIEVAPRTLGGSSGPALRAMLTDPLYKRLIRTIVVEGVDLETGQLIRNHDFRPVFRVPPSKVGPALDAAMELNGGVWVDAVPTEEQWMAWTRRMPAERIWRSFAGEISTDRVWVEREGGAP